MFEIFSSIITIFLSIYILVKIYKHRHLLKQLTKKEWILYIVSLIAAISIFLGIVYLGEEIIHDLPKNWFKSILNVVIILIALFICNSILEKFMPKKIKDFYS